MSTDFFTFDNKGYTKAKNWVEQNNLEHEINSMLQNEKNQCNITYVYLVNKFKLKTFDK